MREITGKIVIPSDCPSINGGSVLIEVRDVSRVDALSTLVAQTQLNDVNISPCDHIPFSLMAPEVSDAQSLDLRVHISSTEANDLKSGDLLTTRSYPVPSRGNLEDISVLVKLI